MKSEIKGDTIVSEIEIAAQPDAVFEALVNPSELALWWGSDEIYRTYNWKIDLRPGGAWSCEAGDPKEKSTVRGKFVEIDRPRVLSYTWNPSWEQIPETTIRYTLEPTASGTRLRVLHTGFAGHAESQKSHNEGWTQVLSWLNQYFLAPERR